LGQLKFFTILEYLIQQTYPATTFENPPTVEKYYPLLSSVCRASPTDSVPDSVKIDVSVYILYTIVPDCYRIFVDQRLLISSLWPAIFPKSIPLRPSLSIVCTSALAASDFLIMWICQK
jgi:hypothetical protein